MTMEEAQEILQEIKHYLTAGNPVWDVDEIAEACDMAIEALRNEINCVKCVHYTERETYTGIKGVCKMDTAHCDKDAISREGLLKSWEELSPRGRTEFDQVIMTIPELPYAEPKTDGVLEQIRWERDVALQTLEEHGIGFGEAADRLYIKIYADDEPSVMAEKLYQICGETQNGEVAKWLKEYFPSAEPRYMGCHGCFHYDQQQTALICRDCKRSYRDMYEDGEACTE